MTEYKTFIAMLDRINAGYGLRMDNNGDVAVLLECDGTNNDWFSVEFTFDDKGSLKSNIMCLEGEEY